MGSKTYTQVSDSSPEAGRSVYGYSFPPDYQVLGAEALTSF